MLTRIKTFLGLAKRSHIGENTPEYQESIKGSSLWFGQPTASGIHLTPEQSLTYTAVRAGVTVLSNGIAQVRFNLMKRSSATGKTIDVNNPLQWLVAYDANPEMSARQLYAAIVIHLIIFGNCYIEVERDLYLRPIALWLLDPREVEPITSKTKALYYRVCGQTMLAKDIIHVSMSSINGVVGVSPLHECRDAIGVGKALEVFASSFFSNGLNARGIIMIPEGMDEVEEENLRKSLAAMHGGAYNSNKLLVLENGATFTSTATPPNEAQFIESRKFQILEVCRVLNLAPMKLQDYDKSSFANLDEVNTDFYQTSILPYIDKIADEFERKLLPTRQERLNYSIEHDPSSLLRGRPSDQIDNWQKLKVMGVYNTNEIRAKLGEAPIKGGEVYMVQANNFQPLNLVVSGENAPAATPEPKPAPDPETLLEIAQAVGSGQLSPEAAKAILKTSFPDIAEGQIAEMVVPVDQPDEEAPQDEPQATEEESKPEPPGEASALVLAARDAVRDVARRMTRREVNAVRKIVRKGDLDAVLVGLDDHYRGETALLAEAYGPALRILSLATGREHQPEEFAKRLVEETRDQILAAVEGPDTLQSLASMVEAWDEDKPARILAMLG